MDEQQLLVGRFDASRGHLRAVAYRMLGSLSEAEDAVQESWLRLQRSDVSQVENLNGWLTKVVARVCLDMLRGRKARSEESLEEHPNAEGLQEESIDPQHEVMMAEAVGSALLVVLDTLRPAERIAFVLHDLFDFSFDEIGSIVDRSPTAARQLASRARRRVQGRGLPDQSDLAHEQELVGAFLAASRGGHFEQLLILLDPDVVLRADCIAQKLGAPTEVRGAENVAKFFLGKASEAQVAIIDGEVGAVVAPRGRPFLALQFVIAEGKVIELGAVAEPEQLRRLRLTIVESKSGTGTI